MSNLKTIAIFEDTFLGLQELKKRWKKHNMTEVILELMKRVENYD